MRQLIAIVSLLVVATSTSAGITRWVDANGKVHYSDQPPPATAKSQKQLDIKTAPSAPQATPDKNDGEKSLAERELEFRKRRVEAEEAVAKQAKDQAEAKRKQDNCAQARRQLQALQDGQKISHYDEKGERVFMEDSARPKAIQEAQQTVDSWCK